MSAREILSEFKGEIPWLPPAQMRRDRMAEGDAARAVNCSMVIRLPGGTITGQFATSPGPTPKPMALTDGSGTYRNASCPCTQTSEPSESAGGNRLSPPTLRWTAGTD